MQFKKVRVLVSHDIMNQHPMTVFEHEVPILQARFGAGKVEPLQDNDSCGVAMVDFVTDKRDDNGEPIVKKVPLERTIEEEWDRMMERAANIQVSETDSRPAPLVVFPRGPLDLTDFYTRLRGNTDNVTELKPATEAPAAETKVEEEELSPREQLKKDLDDLGVEYKGNAKTVDLQLLYDEVTNTNVSSDIQN